MYNQFQLGRDFILLDDREKFINIVSEIFEGNFHFTNIKLNLASQYSKCTGCGNLDSFILYEIKHEKDHLRKCLFSHLVNDFSITYNSLHTNLLPSEKFIIFLKVIQEVRNVYGLETCIEIFKSFCEMIQILPSDIGRLQNGKMWHDYYFNGFVEYASKFLK